MIYNSEAAAAITVAQEFDSRKLFLNATPGTPLATLVDCTSLTLGSISGQTEYNPTPEAIAYITQDLNPLDATSELSQHTLTLNALVADIAPAVQSHLNFAKNTVRPLVTELVTSIKEAIEAIPLNTQYNLEVVVNEMPDPMFEPSFEDAVMDFKDVAYDSNVIWIGLPECSAPEVIAKLDSGSASVNKSILNWVAKKGEAFFENVYQAVFTASPSEARFESLVNDYDNGVDAACAIYILATKLYDNPPEGVTHSLKEYNSVIAKIRNQAAVRLIQAYNEYERFKMTGLLIKTITDKRIVVVAQNYKPWMDSGGNNAVLFGSALSDTPEKFTAAIDARKAEFLTTWERQNAYLTLTERNKRFIYCKDIAKERTIKLVNDNFQQSFGHLREGGVVDINIPEYEQFLINLNTFVDNMTEDSLVNLWTLAQCLVCECLFYYTDAGKILSGIEKACQDNPEIEIREAALLATIVYVTDYVSDQMAITGL